MNDETPEISEQELRIMTAFEQGFQGINLFDQVTDVGSWYMTITNEDNEEFNIRGSLLMHGEGLMSVLSSFSDLIRKELNMPDLFVFDGKVKNNGE